MFGKFCHGREIDVLNVRIRHLGLVPIMALQLASVVIAGKIEIVQARHYSVVNDPDNVGLFHVFRHAVDGCPVLGQGRKAKTLAIAFHHFG